MICILTIIKALISVINLVRLHRALLSRTRSLIHSMHTVLYTSGFSSQRASNIELWWFLLAWQALNQVVQLLVILDCHDAHVTSLFFIMIHTHTHAHTHICIYIYCVRACVCTQCYFQMRLMSPIADDIFFYSTLILTLLWLSLFINYRYYPILLWYCYWFPFLFAIVIGVKVLP